MYCKRLLQAFPVALCLFVGCKDDDGGEEPIVESATVLSVEDLSCEPDVRSAKVSVSLGAEDVAFDETGVVFAPFAETDCPTAAHKRVSASVVSSNAFSVDITSLTPGRTYSCRAYVRTEGTYTYSASAYFTTKIDPEARVTTLDPSQLGSFKAVVSGVASEESFKSIGIEFANNPGFSNYEDFPSSNNAEKTVSASFRGLTPDSTYYYRAYVVDYKTDGRIYGETIALTARPLADVVDLGLSVKWLSKNLGSSDYYSYNAVHESPCFWAWGLTVFKMKPQLSECPSSSPEPSIVGTDYDIAKVTYGDGYTLPSRDEVDELLNGTSKEWITLRRTDAEGNQISGFLMTSNVNGRDVFFPAAGLVQYNNGIFAKKYQGDYGYYWTGTLSTGNNAQAYVLSFNNKSANVGSQPRTYLFTVRAVKH